jgi:hypothetical protein
MRNAKPAGRLSAAAPASRWVHLIIMPHDRATPYRTVCVFSGHLIDAPGRATPRFPAAAEPVAAEAIAAALARIGWPGDLGVCGGASGADLMFAEAALRRGLDLHLHLPLPEPAFLATSVDCAGARWRERYFAVLRDPHTRRYIADERLGRLPPGRDPYVRNNLWMLDEAQHLGNGAPACLCLWDGDADSDRPGGTAHLVREAQRRGFPLHWLDTRALFGLAGAVRPETGSGQL